MIAQACGKKRKAENIEVLERHQNPQDINDPKVMIQTQKQSINRNDYFLKCVGKDVGSCKFPILQIDEENPIVLGRGTELNGRSDPKMLVLGIPWAEGCISRSQARIEKKGEFFQLHSVGMNPTCIWKNTIGKIVRKGESSPLEFGDIIIFDGINSDASFNEKADVIDFSKFYAFQFEKDNNFPIQHTAVMNSSKEITEANERCHQLEQELIVLRRKLAASQAAPTPPLSQQTQKADASTQTETGTEEPSQNKGAPRVVCMKDSNDDQNKPIVPSTDSKKLSQGLDPGPAPSQTFDLATLFNEDVATFIRATLSKLERLEHLRQSGQTMEDIITRINIEPLCRLIRDLDQFLGKLDLKRRAGPVTQLYRQWLKAVLGIIISPLFHKQWRNWGNPFTDVITRENCQAKGVPNYFEIVDQAMNLTWIKEKIRKDKYTRFGDFDSDIKLMINNALKFNKKGESVYAMALTLRQLYVDTLEDIKPLLAQLKNFSSKWNLELK